MTRRSPAFAEASRAHDVSTLAGSRRYVKAGVSLGVSFEHGRPRLLVNLAASRDEGMDIGSQVLRLAEVLR